MAKKFYGVLKGYNPGVYDNWEEVKVQTNGFSGAVYQGFKSIEEAHEFVYGTPLKEEPVELDEIPFIAEVDIYTDGSYKDDKIGFGIVICKENGEIIKDCGRFLGSAEDCVSRNVVGEIYAIIRAIQLIKANDLDKKNITIYHDYEGVSKWITGEWTPRKPLTKRYVEYFKTYMKGVNYRFVHVYSHTNDPLNDEADRLSKLGTTL